MVKADSDSTLSYALLGLIWQKPCSGYDLRKFFSMTPIRSFSDSPGAIYPALRRLEGRKLIRSRIEQKGAKRQRRVFEITSRGRLSFRRWQNQPIARDDIVHGTDALMMRFAFMDEFADRATTLRFLMSFRQQLAAYLTELRRYLKANRQFMSVSGRLALESGMQGYETLFRWTRSALATYQRLATHQRKEN